MGRVVEMDGEYCLGFIGSVIGDLRRVVGGNDFTVGVNRCGSGKSSGVCGRFGGLENGKRSIRVIVWNSKGNNKKSKVVWREFGGDQDETDHEEKGTVEREKQMVRVRKSTKGRNGKVVTVVTGVKLEQSETKALLQKLKKKVCKRHDRREL